jgi:hypothetical protein
MKMGCLQRLKAGKSRRCQIMNEGPLSVPDGRDGLHLLPPVRPPLQGPIRQIDHLIIAIRSVHPADQMVGCYEERAGSGKR